MRSQRCNRALKLCVGREQRGTLLPHPRRDRGAGVARKERSCAGAGTRRPRVARGDGARAFALLLENPMWPTPLVFRAQRQHRLRGRRARGRIDSRHEFELGTRIGRVLGALGGRVRPRRRAASARCRADAKRRRDAAYRRRLLDRTRLSGAWAQALKRGPSPASAAPRKSALRDALAQCPASAPRPQVMARPSESQPRLRPQPRALLRAAPASRPPSSSASRSASPRSARASLSRPRA